MKPINYNGQRILTTQFLAQLYNVEAKLIQQNFTNNKSRYEEGKHFYHLKGEELKAFKMSIENFDVVARKTPQLLLWTERGAFLHAKSLGTDSAWEVYEQLVETYFSVRTQRPIINTASLKPSREMEKEKYLLKQNSQYVDVRSDAKAQKIIKRIKEHITAMNVTLDLANKHTELNSFNSSTHVLKALGLTICNDCLNLANIKLTSADNPSQNISNM